MQETLSFFSTSKSSILCPKLGNFPSQNHDFPRTRLHFPTPASKTTPAAVVSAPSKPSTLPSQPRVPPPPPPSSDFQEKMYYLDSIGLDVFSLVTDHRPILLAASLPEVKSTVDHLTFLGFKSQDFRRIVSMCPEILSTPPNSVIAVFTFLLREAGVPGSRIRKVIHRRPRLLVSSVKHCLRPTLYFLQSIGISSAHRHTYLLSCSVEEKLIPRIHYFEGIGFSHRDATALFRRFPQLFNYSVRENIEPKLNYFVVEMGRELKELKEFPHYFSFSLENRIKPRHQSCVEKGVCFPLPVLLKTTDEAFRDRLDKSGDSSSSSCLYAETVEGFSESYSTLPLSSSPLFRVDFTHPSFEVLK